MSFCSFSKEFLSASFTAVENQFILKYMPQSDGFTVKVYLYGLYLCSSAQTDMDLPAMAEFFKCTEKEVEDAFCFWEDYDLVRVLSRQPFAVEYLPVATALGRPKRIRYEKYADFNKELQNKFGKVGKFISYNDNIRFMNFLQENNIEPQAFLLIVQYCIDKKGEKVTQAYIFNKAKKFISQNIVTYQQVEKELSGYNIHEKELESIFTALNAAKSPAEGDYTLYDKWTNGYGFSLNAIRAAARFLKRGSMENLDILLSRLHEEGKTDEKELTEYLSEQELLSALTFKIARKLSVKINSPQTYIDEYVSKWYNEGFEGSALEDIAVYCTKISANSFLEMDALLDELYKNGIISDESVSEYIAQRNAELKLLVKIKAAGNGIKISSSALAMIETWRGWKFSDAMIEEAAKRSAGAANSLSYMNKILSGWKKDGVFRKEDIKDLPSAPAATPAYVNPAVKALDDKAERERYYEARRRKAQAVADKYIKKAETNPDYVRVSSELSAGNIELAKAKVFDPSSVPAIQSRIELLRQRQRQILAGMGIDEAQLLPAYHCQKCKDTGFLPNGKACDCYQKE